MNLEARTEAEAKEGYFLLTSAHGSLSLCFIYNQDCLTRDVTAHSGLDPPASVIN